MADGQLLPERAVRELNEVKKIVLGSTRTNRARRRRRRGGGGAAAASGGIYARVTTAIPRALSQLPAEWGQGQVKILNLATGIVATEEHSVGNFLDTGFVVDALVELMAVPPGVVGVQGLNYLVANGTCHAYPWKENPA